MDLGEFEASLVYLVSQGYIMRTCLKKTDRQTDRLTGLRYTFFNLGVQRPGELNPFSSVGKPALDCSMVLLQSYHYTCDKRNNQAHLFLS